MGAVNMSSFKILMWDTCVCLQYKMDRDGIQETRVEHRVVLSSADDDFDYDAVSMMKRLALG